MAVVGNNPQLSTDLQLFSDEFKWAFDHPTNGADAAGRLHNIQQGPRGIAEYTLEFHTLAADSGWERQRPPELLSTGSLRGDEGPPRTRPSTHIQQPHYPGPPSRREAQRVIHGAAQHSGSSARTPVTRPGGRYIAPLGPTPVPPLSPSRAPLTRPQEEEEPMQLGRSRLSPETREQRMRDQTLPVLWEGGAHHPGLSGPAKRSGSLGGRVLVSRT